MALPCADRKRKLKDTLLMKSNYTLTEDELNSIVSSIDLSVQYSVYLLTDRRIFESALVLDKTGGYPDTGKIVFGHVLFGTQTHNGRSPFYFEPARAAAVVRTCEKEEHIIRAICIYIPKSRFIKGGREHAARPAAANHL